MTGRQLIPPMLHVKRNKMIRRCLIVISILLGIQLHGIPQDYEIQERPNGNSIRIEVNNPCGKIVLKENMEFLEKNVLAYFYYDQGTIVKIMVRLTCKYRERHMPKNDAPSMSKNKFDQILKNLNKRKSFGTLIGDLVTIAGGGVDRHSREYEKAQTNWVEYPCMNPDKSFGCGIKRIDVFYADK
jgi:hypothetical protein